MQDYSWSATLGSAPDNRPPAPELQIFERCTSYPLGSGRLLLVSADQQRRTVVTHDVMNALALCAEFRPMEGHLETIARHLPHLGGKLGELLGLLQNLQRQGFFVSARRFLADLAPAPTAPTAPTAGSGSPPSVYIRTCDRPEPLRRLLASLSKLPREPARRCEVIDDSRDPENRKRNRSLVEQLGAETGLAAHYHGRQCRQARYQALLEALPECASAVRFLRAQAIGSDAITPGAALNYAFLVSAGKRLLLIDDDVVCRVLGPPQTAEGIEFSSRQKEARFFADETEWLERAEALAMDPLHEHAKMLGLSLAQALAEPGHQTRSEDAVRFLSQEELGAIAADSRLLVTTSGLYGDPGTASNEWLLGLQGASRDSLLGRDAADYARNKTARSLWLGRARPQFSVRCPLMTGSILGVDNRALVPPTFSYLRNEDYLFGVALQFVHPRSLGYEFPWALPHLSIPARTWDASAMGQPVAVGLLRFLGDYLGREAARCNAQSAEDRLRHLAGLLFDLASISDGALRRTVEDYRLSALANVLQANGELLERFPQAPDYWRRDVENGLRANQQVLAKPADSLFVDLADLAAPGMQGEMFRRLVEGYAEAVADWPKIRAVAQEQADR